MDDDKTAAEVQLECVAKQNPLVTERLPHEGATSDEESKPPILKEPPPRTPTPPKPPKKLTLKADSVGMAGALNAQRTMPKKRADGGGGGRKSGAPPSPAAGAKGKGEEDNVDDDDSKPPAAAREPGPPAPPAGAGGEPLQVATDSGNVAHITECATAWSIITFVLTTAHTGFYAALAFTEDRVYTDFYAWVTKPICITAMAVSFMLKPRRRDSAYMTFLNAQYAILTLGSTVSELDDQTLLLTSPRL